MNRCGLLPEAIPALRISTLQNTLASAAIDARRGEYEPARQAASDFFTHLGMGIAQTAATAPTQPSPSPRVEETAPSTVEEAALVIQNRPITVFRSRFQGRSPRVRMEGARRQFEEATNSPQAGAVTARTIPQGVLVSIGEESIFVLTPGDLLLAQSGLPVCVKSPRLLSCK
jgi:hypothetical protein